MERIHPYDVTHDAVRVICHTLDHPEEELLLA